MMINFYSSDLAKFVFAFLLALSQLSTGSANANVSMIHAGDEIDGMLLTTGAADARPLWVFCGSEVSENVTTANCRVPQVSTLAIGHVFFGTDEAFKGLDWSQLKWELYFDDALIDLDTFGTYDYLLPTMTPFPSLVREVFMKFKAWDIVLTNLQPGAHTIEGRVYASDEEYRWVVNLNIEDQPLSEWEPSHQFEKSGSVRLRPLQRENGLSPFHASDRFYG
jgi:hypothetical protein